MESTPRLDEEGVCRRRGLSKASASARSTCARIAQSGEPGQGQGAKCAEVTPVSQQSASFSPSSRAIFVSELRRWKRSLTECCYAPEYRRAKLVLAKQVACLPHFLYHLPAQHSGDKRALPSLPCFCILRCLLPQDCRRRADNALDSCVPSLLLQQPVATIQTANGKVAARCQIPDRLQPPSLLPREAARLPTVWLPSRASRAAWPAECYRDAATASLNFGIPMCAQRERLHAAIHSACKRPRAPKEMGPPSGAGSTPTVPSTWTSGVSASSTPSIPVSSGSGDGNGRPPTRFARRA